MLHVSGCNFRSSTVTATNETISGFCSTAGIGVTSCILSRLPFKAKRKHG